MSRRILLVALVVVQWTVLAATLPAQQTVRPERTIWVGRENQQFRGNANPGAVVSCVALSPTGETVAVGDDHLVHTYAADGTPQGALPGHSQWVRGAAFGPDGRTLVTVGDDRKVIFWQGNRPARQDTLPMQAYGVVHSGHLVAVIGFGRQMQLYDAEGRHAGVLDCPCRDMRAVAFSSDGQWLATGGRNGKLHVWQMPQQARVIDKPRAHRRGIFAVAFSPDGRLLATAGDGEWIHIWDLHAPDRPAISIRKTEKLRCKTRALAFCGPDRLAAGGTSDIIRVWDLSRVRQLPGDDAPTTADLQLVGHAGSVTSIVHDARNDAIISGGYDTTLRTWKLSTPETRTTNSLDGRIR